MKKTTEAAAARMSQCFIRKSDHLLCQREKNASLPDGEAGKSSIVHFFCFLHFLRRVWALCFLPLPNVQESIKTPKICCCLKMGLLLFFFCCHFSGDKSVWVKYGTGNIALHTHNRAEAPHIYLIINKSLSFTLTEWVQRFDFFLCQCINNITSFFFFTYNYKGFSLTCFLRDANSSSVSC